MTELKKTLGAVQLFSIGFGSIVGVGWIVLMGFWFSRAGPVGTALAFVAGGLLLALVGLCYAEMSTMIPVAGGEAAYAYAVFGSPLAFVVGWFMTLMSIAVIPYLAISLGWLMDVLIPGFAGPALYSWRGSPVYSVSLVLALVWTVWLGYLNYRGIRSAARTQDLLTYGKIALSVVFFAAGVFGGKLANLEPAIANVSGGSITSGVVAVLAMTPWFFGGFNFIPQVMEEKAPGTSLKLVGRVVVGSLLAAAAFYAVAAIAIGMAGPWQRIVDQGLPSAAAFRLGLGSELLARLVLVAGLFGVVTVGNGAAIAATRLLFALSRARLITPVFEQVHLERGSPVRAIIFVTLLALAGAFLGRNGITPIVNVGSSCAAMAYLVTCLGVLRLRQREPNRERPYRVPLGSLVAFLGALASAFLLYSSLRSQLVDAKGGFPLEWATLLIWGAIGWVLWRQARPGREALPEVERQRIIVGG